MKDKVLGGVAVCGLLFGVIGTVMAVRAEAEAGRVRAEAAAYLDRISKLEERQDNFKAWATEVVTHMDKTRERMVSFAAQAGQLHEAVATIRGAIETMVALQKRTEAQLANFQKMAWAA